MDEILASIRRIIESGDGPNEARGRKADGSDAPTGKPADHRGVEVASSPADDHVPMPRFDVRYLNSAANERAYAAPVEGLDGPGRADHEVGSDRARESGERSAPRRSFEDEQWELRSTNVSVDRGEAEPEYDGAQDRDAPVLELPPYASRAENENEALGANGDDPNGESARDFAFEFDDAAFEAALRNDTWQAPPEREEAIERETGTVVEFAAFEPPPNGEPASTGPAVVPPAVEDLNPTAEPPRLHMPESVIAGASALLSTQAGDQVAAAFDDLTHAIREGHMRSMEEMSRELLRPMLREWLEDNLPRIVERLVREEIERIARGPRR